MEKNYNQKNYKNINQIGRDYDKIDKKIFMPQFHYDEIIKSFLGFKNNGNLLDFGCGNGLLLERIPNTFNKFGIDISEKILENAIHKNPEVTFSNSINKFEKNFFDIIVLSEVLEHFQNPINELKIIKEYLNEDGLLVITVPNGDRFNLGRILKFDSIFQPITDILYTWSELSLMLKLLSFRPIYFNSFGGYLFKEKKLNKILNKLYRVFDFLLSKTGLFYLNQKNLIVICRIDKNIKFSLSNF